MSRLEKILAGFLLFLIGLIAVLVVLFWQQARTTPRLLEEASPAATEPAVISARDNYERALDVAKTWATDAQLLSARGNWPVNSMAAEDASWGFVFYAPERSETALIAVKNGTARLVSSSQTDQQPVPVPADAWEVDSPAVVETLLAEGGQAFLQTHTNVELILSLSANRQLVWTAVLVAQDSNEILQMQVDPTSGDVMTAPEQSLVPGAVQQ